MSSTSETSSQLIPSKTFNCALNNAAYALAGLIYLADTMADPSLANLTPHAREYVLGQINCMPAGSRDWWRSLLDRFTEHLSSGGSRETVGVGKGFKFTTGFDIFDTVLNYGNLVPFTANTSYLFRTNGQPRSSVPKSFTPDSHTEGATSGDEATVSGSPAFRAREIFNNVKDAVSDAFEIDNPIVSPLQNRDSEEEEDDDIFDLKGRDDEDQAGQSSQSQTLAQISQGPAQQQQPSPRSASSSEGSTRSFTSNRRGRSRSSSESEPAARSLLSRIGGIAGSGGPPSSSNPSSSWSSGSSRRGSKAPSFDLNAALRDQLSRRETTSSTQPPAAAPRFSSRPAHLDSDRFTPAGSPHSSTTSTSRLGLDDFVAIESKVEAEKDRIRRMAVDGKAESIAQYRGLAQQVQITLAGIESLDKSEFKKAARMGSDPIPYDARVAIMRNEYVELGKLVAFLPAVNSFQPVIEALPEVFVEAPSASEPIKDSTSWTYHFNIYIKFAARWYPCLREPMERYRDYFNEVFVTSPELFTYYLKLDEAFRRRLGLPGAGETFDDIRKSPDLLLRTVGIPAAAALASSSKVPSSKSPSVGKHDSEEPKKKKARASRNKTDIEVCRLFNMKGAKHSTENHQSRLLDICSICLSADHPAYEHVGDAGGTGGGRPDGGAAGGLRHRAGAGKSS